jgi:predicted transcriptional regulator
VGDLPGWAARATHEKLGSSSDNGDSPGTPLRGVIPELYYGMKTAVSLPDDLFASAEALAERLGVSRSHLFATALAEFLAKHQGRKVTAQLDAVYSTQSSSLDPAVRRAQAKAISTDTW